jgi:NADP-dependent 3-hydroxy acid dehydrogenase YdfG
MARQATLSGKTAIVTGASSGIGRAIAERLGEAGAYVYLAGRTAAAMDASKSRIEAAGGRATPVVVDVRDAGGISGLVEQAVRETGRLDIMVNNAGLSYPAAIVSGEPEQWREMLEVNILALLTGCKEAVLAMRGCGAQGHIVNISSVAALRPDSGVYGSTKHAVNVISNTLRGELEDDSIRVVTIMPGAISTNFGRNFDPAVITPLVRASGVEVDVKQGERLPDEVFAGMPDGIRTILGRPEDVAGAVFYAVTQPIEVNVAEIVVRPPKQLSF